MRMTRSARRHGVRDEAIRHAVTNAIRLVDTDDGVFVIGADASGQMLELVARPTEDGDLVVFHAMPLRPVNAKRYLMRSVGCFWKARLQQRLAGQHSRNPAPSEAY